MQRTESERVVDDSWESIVGRFKVRFGLEAAVRASVHQLSLTATAYAVRRMGDRTKLNIGAPGQVTFWTRPVQMLIDVELEFPLPLAVLRDALNGQGVALDDEIDSAASRFATAENDLLIRGVGDVMPGLSALGVNESDWTPVDFTISTFHTAIRLVDDRLFGAALSAEQKLDAEALDLLLPSQQPPLVAADDLRDKVIPLLRGGTVRVAEGIDRPILLASRHPAVRLVIGRTSFLDVTSIDTQKDRVNVRADSAIALLSMTDRPPVVVFKAPRHTEPARPIDSRRRGSGF